MQHSVDTTVPEGQRSHSCGTELLGNIRTLDYTVGLNTLHGKLY